jgi:hypothetical protein
MSAATKDGVLIFFFPDGSHFQSLGAVAVVVADDKLVRAFTLLHARIVRTFENPQKSADQRIRL